LDLDAEKSGEFREFVGDMADADGAMMGGTVRIPIIHESPCADGEAVTAIGISNLKDQARN
jgi:hypothetical protein